MEEATREIRLVISDDLAMFREALRSVLEREPDLRIVGEAAGDSDTFDQVRSLKPDLLLLNLMMTHGAGMEILRRLATARSPVRTIILVDSAARGHVTQALALGVRGVIPERAGTQSLIQGIRAVASGDYWMDSQTIAELIDYLRSSTQKPDPATSNGFKLTPREMEIVTELVDGRTNKEIARKFSISEQTVKHHLTNIFAKVGVANRLELALLAMHQQPFVSP